jgi:hypothetical protein
LVGQLVDANCSVTFEKSTVQILHKNANILEGQRNLKNGLWTVDLNGKAPHRDLSHPPPSILGKSRKDATHHSAKKL